MTCVPVTSSQAMGGASSPTSSTATGPCGQLSGTPTPAQSYAPAFLGSGSSREMCETWTFAHWIRSMRSAADSLARTSAPPATGSASPGSAPASTANYCEPLNIWDLPGCSWKTAPESAPKAGTSSSATLWRSDIPGAMESLPRLMLARRISAIDGGALPTVTVTTAKQGFLSEAGGTSKGRPLLAKAALTWPTPAATDHKTPYRGEALVAQQAKRSKPLRDAISAPAGGKLNPLWVEWLMGWPLGHTAIGPSESAALEMGKSRSRQRSRGGSSVAPLPHESTVTNLHNESMK